MAEFDKSKFEAKAAAEAAKAASQTPAGGAQPAKADASKGDK